MRKSQIDWLSRRQCGLAHFSRVSRLWPKNSGFRGNSRCAARAVFGPIAPGIDPPPAGGQAMTGTSEPNSIAERPLDSGRIAPTRKSHRRAHAARGQDRSDRNRVPEPWLETTCGAVGARRGVSGGGKAGGCCFLDLERCLQGAVVRLVAEKSRGFNMRGFNQGALIIDLSEAYRPAGEGPLERSLRQRSGRFRIGRWQSPPRGLPGFGFRALFVFRRTGNLYGRPMNWHLTD